MSSIFKLALMGHALRSIRSPMTTTSKAFQGDRRVFRSQTVTVAAAPVAAATQDPPV